MMAVSNNVAHASQNEFGKAGMVFRTSTPTLNWWQDRIKSSISAALELQRRNKSKNILINMYTYEYPRQECYQPRSDPELIVAISWKAA